MNWAAIPIIELLQMKAAYHQILKDGLQAGLKLASNIEFREAWDAYRAILTQIRRYEVVALYQPHLVN